MAFLYQRQLLKAQFQYEQKLQEINFQNDFRQKASIVAEIFSIWMQSAEKSKSSKELTTEEFTRLNKLCWECALWLPDEILVEMTKRLSNNPEAKD